MSNDLGSGLELRIETVNDNKARQAGEPVLKVPKLFPPSAAAERMRLYRQRRRDGVRRITSELRDFEIYDLIILGLLRHEMRNDGKAIEHALHKLLDQALGWRDA